MGEANHTRGRDQDKAHTTTRATQKNEGRMTTSVRVHTALQQHGKHGVEGKIPTQGQRPLMP